MKAIANYFIGVRSELAQTTWPKASGVVKLTLIVLLASLIVGVFVGASDAGFTKLLSVIIK